MDEIDSTGPAEMNGSWFRVEEDIREETIAEVI